MARAQVQWPEWWHWELEISNHVRERMVDRRFGETDLREMLERATGFHPDEEGRWGIETERSGLRWEVIVEPDPPRHLLVVVTAYEVD